MYYVFNNMDSGLQVLYLSPTMQTLNVRQPIICYLMNNICENDSMVQKEDKRAVNHSIKCVSDLGTYGVFQ